MNSKCQLCGTPGVKYVEHLSQCVGCGSVPLTALVIYNNVKLKDISFENATFTFERSPFATRMSFGEWLCSNKLRIGAKP